MPHLAKELGQVCCHLKPSNTLTHWRGSCNCGRESKSKFRHCCSGEWTNDCVGISQRSITTPEHGCDCGKCVQRNREAPSCDSEFLACSREALLNILLCVICLALAKLDCALTSELSCLLKSSRRHKMVEDMAVKMLY